MELKPITVSFKNTPEEKTLYDIIDGHSSRGAFIKDVLIEVLVKKQPVAIDIKENCSDELSEILEI